MTTQTPARLPSREELHRALAVERAILDAWFEAVGRAYMRSVDAGPAQTIEDYGRLQKALLRAEAKCRRSLDRVEELVGELHRIEGFRS